MPSPKFTGPRNMRFFRSALESPDMRDFIQSIEASSSETIEMILQTVRSEVLTYLRSYTNRVKAGRDYLKKWTLDSNSVRVPTMYSPTDALRPVHPGGWADVSFDLMNRYYARVDPTDEGGWRLTIGNRSEHARYVEARDGMFVVSGVMEAGGPVEWSIARAIKRLAPGWRLSVNTLVPEQLGDPHIGEAVVLPGGG